MDPGQTQGDTWQRRESGKENIKVFFAFHPVPRCAAQTQGRAPQDAQPKV